MEEELEEELGEEEARLLQQWGAAVIDVDRSAKCKHRSTFGVHYFPLKGMSFNEHDLNSKSGFLIVFNKPFVTINSNFIKKSSRNNFYTLRTSKEL